MRKSKEMGLRRFAFLRSYKVEVFQMGHIDDLYDNGRGGKEEMIWLS